MKLSSLELVKQWLVHLQWLQYFIFSQNQTFNSAAYLYYNISFLSVDLKVLIKLELIQKHVFTRSGFWGFGGMIHQVKYYEQVTNTPFYAVFSIDDHSQQNTLGPQGPHTHNELEQSDTLLRGIVVITAGVSILLASLLISPRSND